MKRLLIYMSAILFATACSGTIDDSDNTGDIPEEYVEPFTLSADKTEVAASGSDYVTFSLKDAYGRDLMADKSALQRINVVSDNGVRVPRMENSARFIANGTYNFTATYMGKECGEPVEVVAKNRAQYEKYHKNVALYKATATWCGPCANMTKTLKNLNEDAKDHLVELCWHFQDAHSLTPAGSEYDCGEIIVDYFNGAGVPTVVLDLMEKVIESSTSAIENAIWNIRAEYPATCGIKVSTEYDEESGEISVVAFLKSSTGGRYDMGMALMLNDQIIPSGTNEGGQYSHIVKATTGNFYMYSDSIMEVAKDSEIFHTWHLDPGTLDIDDLSVAVFALVEDGYAARIDNIVEVKVGESVDYVLNE